MTIQAGTSSFWDKLQDLSFPAFVSYAPDHKITDVLPDRTKGVWLNLTPDSAVALLELATMGVKLRQHHLWVEAKKAHTVLSTPILAEEKYRLALYEVSKMVQFPLEGGTIIFSDNEECPDIEILTVTVAREDSDCAADCIPDDPEE